MGIKWRMQIMDKETSNLTIELKRQINKAMKQYKVNECLLCGQINPQFCNSHSVPQFVLKNIAKEGHVKTSNELIDIDLLGVFDYKKGINNSGTFHNICRSCDSQVFKDYESEEVLLKHPTDKMLLEILLKNILYKINKKYREKGVYDYTEDEFGLKPPTAANHDIDLNEDIIQLNKIKKSLGIKRYIPFNLFFWVNLPYVVPISFQTNFYLYGDLEGNIVNNLYSSNVRDVPQEIIFCVFPLSSSTVVFGFNKKENRKNNVFISQFTKKSLREKLEIINYINLLYNEDYYLSPDINPEIFNNRDLLEISSEFNIIERRIGDHRPRINKEFLNALKNNNSIPNLLSDEYRLR